MDFTFPDKYYHVARYFDYYIGGDMETTTKLDNEQKLMFYALRMQADQGPCNTPAPALWHITERYKHQAWSRLGNMSKFEAMVFFVKQFERVITAGSATKEVCWAERVKELPMEGSASSMGPSTAVTESIWDEDVKAHCEPTSENIAFLASEVMRVRQQLREALAARHYNTLGGNEAAASSQGASVPLAWGPCIRGPAVVRPGPSGYPLVPPVRAEAVWASTSSAAQGMMPPRKPGVAECHIDTPSPGPAVLSATPAPASAPTPAAPPPGDASRSSWGEWIGW